jgi:hypothetical protein
LVFQKGRNQPAHLLVYRVLEVNLLDRISEGRVDVIFPLAYEPTDYMLGSSEGKLVARDRSSNPR